MEEGVERRFVWFGWLGWVGRVEKSKKKVDERMGWCWWLMRLCFLVFLGNCFFEAFLFEVNRTIPE